LIYYTTGEIRLAREGDEGCVLQCSILHGIVFQTKTLLLGAPCTAGFDSHVSPNGYEHVVFSSDQILPKYVLHYKVVKAVKPKGSGFDGSIEKLGPNWKKGQDEDEEEEEEEEKEEKEEEEDDE
jgi:hypothetical protein